MRATDNFNLFTLLGNKVEILEKIFDESTGATLIKLPVSISSGIYILDVNEDESKIIVVKKE